MPAGAIEAVMRVHVDTRAALLSMPAGAIEAGNTSAQKVAFINFQCQLVRLRPMASTPSPASTPAFNASWCD